MNCQLLVLIPSKNPSEEQEETSIELARSTDDEKQSQLNRLKVVHEANKDKAQEALKALRLAVQNNANVFEELMEAGRYCSLGQITDTFFEVGGQYRRNM